MTLRIFGLILLGIVMMGGLVALLFGPVLAASLTLTTSTHPLVATTSTVARTGTTTTLGTTLPTGMLILAQDNFQRPDQEFWGTSSHGQTWSSDASTNPAYRIANHAGQITGGTGALNAVINTDTAADAEILLGGSVSKFNTAGTINLGAVLRWTDTNNFYKALFDGSTVQILKVVNGQITLLGKITLTTQANTAYSLRFRALGSNLFAKVWPTAQTEPTTWNLMAIDTALTTGLGGIRVLIQPGVVIHVITFLETNVPNM
jgi:hypothetical protein